MLLVLWAATFGVDEFGSLIKDDRDESAASPTSRAGHALQKANSITKHGESTFKHVGKRNREKTSSMLGEILELIDFHGVMRRPTFDGVRILLLTLPLMEEVPHLERMAMYEAALSQARALCAPIPKHNLPSALPPFSAEESVLRSRIYLYAHTLEGISTAIKGGYLLYHNDDVDTLRRMVYLSPERTNASFAHHNVAQIAPGDVINGRCTIAIRDAQLSHLSAMAFRLSNVCRKVHDVLTGSKAARRVEEHNLIDVTGMREIWQELDQCWHGFSAMKNDSAIDSSKVSIDCFVDAWLIFIFECHNIVLEHLKHITSAEDSPVFSHAASPLSSSPYLSPHEFYLEARARCVQLLPSVLRVIRHHLVKKTKDENLNLFAWDTGLVRDGCFFAALLSISLQEDTRCIDGHRIKVEESDDFITPEEGVRLCLSALTEMRWVFSKSDERIEAIHAAIKDMNEKRANILSKGPSQSAPSSTPQRLGSSMDNSHCLPYSENFARGLDAEVVTDTRERRRSLSVNIIRSTRRRAESAPDIAYNTADARINDWPTYTPPTSASTAYNSSSPATRAIASPASYKSGHDDSIFCYVPEALDHFAYPGFITPSNIPAAQALYHHRNAFLDTRDVQDVSDGLSPCAFTSTESSLQLTSDIDSYVNDFYT
ncbi:hypothetical protein APHAL10511_001295 [Amanita phalloides]|nr:hypothetical protein APHAL10511_001295 [Amanita phalloides]